MQGLWYGDRRDRVKWGALIHLAHDRGIPTIIQVAYFRESRKYLLETSEGEVPVPSEVWDHFSNLRQIERLGRTTEIRIFVFDEVFDPKDRDAYIKSVAKRIAANPRPRVVFLDPDNGIEPSTPRPAHVTQTEIQRFWTRLLPKDLLAIYQHGDHSSTWLDERSRKMSEACEGATIHSILAPAIAKDVAILWCEK